MKKTLLFSLVLLFTGFVTAQEQTRFHFIVKKVKTLEELADVLCVIKKDSVVVKELRSDGLGELSFALPADDNYRIMFIQPGYESKKYDMDTRQLAGISVDLDVEMVPNNWLLYKGSFHDRTADQYLAATKIYIRNLYTGETDSMFTDDAGLVYYYMPPRQKFEIITGSEWHLNKRAIVNTDCGKGDEMKFCLSGFNFENFVDPDFAPKTLVGTVMLDSIRLNQSFSLSILYDVGSAKIRSDAVPVLDYLISFLQDNPRISIELGSHTDSRGDAVSNERLSQQRAESALQYIVAKGISKSRITAKGYGENQLLNGCKDGVNCSEDEHQENRRTEVKIVKLD